MTAARSYRILLIDTNVYFSKRLSDALRGEGFEVTHSTQPSFALTTLEYDTPAAIVCSTNMREMGALEIARLVRADVKNSALPVIALGDGSQRALMEAFQAGCDDYIDRTRPPAVIAAHVKNVIVSKADGFQPTQMLAQSDTSLSGSLTHHDLPGVMQMLGHAHQTGALHINSGDTDALLFFDAGAISHAECGALFGDEAVIHILKSCFRNNSGVYKFVYGSACTQRTVLRSATDLMLDAMREVDESLREEESIDQPAQSIAENPSTGTIGLSHAETLNEVPCPETSSEAHQLHPESLLSQQITSGETGFTHVENEFPHSLIPDAADCLSHGNIAQDLTADNPPEILPSHNAGTDFSVSEAILFLNEPSPASPSECSENTSASEADDHLAITHSLDRFAEQHSSEDSVVASEAAEQPNTAMLNPDTPPLDSTGLQAESADAPQEFHENTAVSPDDDRWSVTPTEEQP